MTTQIAREETRCHNMGYSFRLAAKVLLYASSHRQDNTYHGLFSPVVEHWLERETALWVHHEGSIRRPIAPWANALTTELHPTPKEKLKLKFVLFNDATGTHWFLSYHRLVDVIHMVTLTHFLEGNSLPPHRLLFSISSKGSFICTFP